MKKTQKKIIFSVSLLLFIILDVFFNIPALSQENKGGIISFLKNKGWAIFEDNHPPENIIEKYNSLETPEKVLGPSRFTTKYSNAIIFYEKDDLSTPYDEMYGDIVIFKTYKSEDNQDDWIKGGVILEIRWYDNEKKQKYLWINKDILNDSIPIIPFFPDGREVTNTLW